MSGSLFRNAQCVSSARRARATSWSRGDVRAGSQLGAALDRLLQLFIRGVEGQDRVVFLAGLDRAHLVERAPQNLHAGKPVLHESSVDITQLLLTARDFFPDRRRHHALLDLGDVVAEHVAEVLVGLDDVLEFETDLGPEGGLSEQVVVREGAPGLQGERRLDGLALARGFDPPRAQQRDDQKPKGAALLRRVLFAHFTGVFDHG